MIKNMTDANIRADFDDVLQRIAHYVETFEINSEQAITTAHHCLLDTLGCGFLALNFPECVKLLGPVVPGAILKHGAKVPGTSYQLDPIQAAFNIGTMIRWLDFNDTWLAAEWGHPSDNLGAILALADYISRQNILAGKSALLMQDVLHAMIKAHEIQGILALENSFNRVGLDHVILVKVASTAVACKLLQCNRTQLLNALSLAWLDGHSLRTYRHAPNTGSRKSWAAGDATSRAVHLALIAKTGETGYPSVLTASQWGFQDVLFNKKSITIAQPFSTYVMENILFKISYPAEFHAQTAVEAAIQLHPIVKNKIDLIEQISLQTQEAGIRIISKSGPLHNPADRDHCLQYMVAIGLLYGKLSAQDYEEDVAADPQIDYLRSKMHVTENKQFSQDYFDPGKRAIANSIQVFFNDGSFSEKVTINYPVGHKRRRKEGIPLLLEKFSANLLSCFDKAKAEKIYQSCLDRQILLKTTVPDFIDQFEC